MYVLRLYNNCIFKLSKHDRNIQVVEEQRKPSESSIFSKYIFKSKCQLIHIHRNAVANQVLHINTSSFDSPTCLEVRSQSWQLIAMIHQWKPVHVSKTHKAEGSLAQKMMDMVTFPETSLSHLPGSKAFFNLK